jgi:hypothetical protein
MLFIYFIYVCFIFFLKSLKDRSDLEALFGSKGKVEGKKVRGMIVERKKVGRV